MSVRRRILWESPNLWGSFFKKGYLNKNTEQKEKNKNNNNEQ